MHIAVLIITVGLGGGGVHYASIGSPSNSIATHLDFYIPAGAFGSKASW